MEAAKTYSESQEYHIMHAIKPTRSLKEINEIISKIAARNEIEILPVEDSSKLALEPKLYECLDEALPIDVSAESIDKWDAEGIKKWDWSSPIIFFGIETNGLEATGPYFGALPPGVSDFHMIKLCFLPSALNHTRPKKDGTVNFREFLENLSKEIFLELSGIKSLAISSKAAGELPAEFNGDMIFHLGIFFGIVNTSYYGGKDAFIEKLREAFHMVPNPTRDATTLKEPEIEELDDETLFFRARYLYTFGDPLPPATAPWWTK
jgi:hypothetical protein